MTLLKDYRLFQNTDFKVLAYLSKFLEKWYRLNSKFHSGHTKQKKVNLLATYKATKQQLTKSLKLLKNKCHSIRQEHCIT